MSRTLVQCMVCLHDFSDGCALHSIIQTPKNVSINQHSACVEMLIKSDDKVVNDHEDANACTLQRSSLDRSSTS